MEGGRGMVKLNCSEYKLCPNCKVCTSEKAGKKTRKIPGHS